MIFETERLVARRWVVEDAEAAHRIYGDADVMRYLGSGDLSPDPDVDFTRRGIERMISRYDTETRPAGFWALEEKETGQVVGSIILAPQEDGEVEVAYHLARARWGEGFATEAAAAAVEYGFANGLPRIVAFAYPQNKASIRVLEKIGMRHEGQREYAGKLLEFFVAERG